MLDKELLFNASVRISEGTALRLEYEGTLVGHDDIEPCDEVVVHESNDVLWWRVIYGNWHQAMQHRCCLLSRA